MNRRDSFEAAYAASHDLPIETFSQYRMGDTYRLPGIASHWRTWNYAMDSAVIDMKGRDWNKPGDIIQAIEAAGLKVAP